MEFAVTKELLNFLLRFRCSNCEFSTLEATPIQKHLRECLRKDKNEFVIKQEEFKPQIEAVLCGETADEFVIELVEEENELKAELDIKDDNVKTIEEDHHLQQPQIEAVLSGEPAEILHEMEDNDDENEDLECVMETDDTIIPELETIEFESNSLRSYKSEDVCGG